MAPEGEGVSGAVASAGGVLHVLSLPRCFAQVVAPQTMKRLSLVIDPFVVALCGYQRVVAWTGV